MSIGAVVARLTAVVVAILLVVGAFVWRDARTSASPSPDPSATDVTAPPTVDMTEVVCAAELRICDHLQLEGVIEGVNIRMADGVTTADELMAASQAPLWITLSSLVDVVEGARDRAGERPLLDRTDPIAVSPLVIVAWDDRAAVLTASCEPVGWSCVGDLAERPWQDAGGESAWGVIKPGQPDPDRSGIGLLVLGQAAADRLGTGTFSARELDTPDFQRWFSILEQAVPSFTGTGGSFFQRMLQFGPASVDVVGTTEAEVAELLGRAGARGASVSVLPATPAVLAEVVIASPSGTQAPQSLVDAVTQALVDVGWRPDAATAPALLSESPALVDEPVRFDGGLLEALRLRWQRVR